MMSNSKCSAALKPASAVTALALLLAPAMAHAQSGTFFDRNNNVGVRDRPRPDYQALGIHEGAFYIYPSVTITPEYDDNVFASSKNKTGDFVTVISPDVLVRSNWSRHELDAHAGLTTNLFAQQSQEDTTNFDVGASGRFDIGSRSDLNGSIGYARNTIARTSENIFTGSLEPIQYGQFNAAFGGEKTFNRLRLSSHVTFSSLSYDDTTDFNGAAVSLSYLNRTSESLGGRADYALSPELSIFTDIRGEKSDYNRGALPAAFDRSSTGYNLSAGTDFDLTRLLRGQVQVGYFSRSYGTPGVGEVSGPSVHGRVEYFFSGLTTLTAFADRSVLDAVDPIAISYVQSTFGGQVDHELRRNIILSARGSYENDVFKGEDRTDDRFSASLSGTYLVNRHIGLTAGYSYLRDDSSGFARVNSFDVSVISLSLTLQL